MKYQKIDLENIYDLPHIGSITEKSEPLLTIIDKDKLGLNERCPSAKCFAFVGCRAVALSSVRNMSRIVCFVSDYLGCCSF